MSNKKSKWDDSLVGPWSTRHMPYVLMERLKKLAVMNGVSVEIMANRVIEVGLSDLERRLLDR